MDFLPTIKLKEPITIKDLYEIVDYINNIADKVNEVVEILNSRG